MFRMIFFIGKVSNRLSWVLSRGARNYLRGGTGEHTVPYISYKSYCTVLYCTVPYCTALYRTALYRTELFGLEMQPKYIPYTTLTSRVTCSLFLKLKFKTSPHPSVKFSTELHLQSFFGSCVHCTAVLIG